jgi:hypothetical protein
MFVIPEIHALSIAFFLLDFIVNKPPFYKTHTENITLNTSQVIFLRMLLNFTISKTFQIKVVDPTALYILYNSPTMSYFLEGRLKFYFFFIPSMC